MSNKDRIILRANEIAIYNNSGETIPALSFAEIISYNQTNQYFEVVKPTSDNLKNEKIIIVPDEIANGKVGIAKISGIVVVKKTVGETIVAGDFVGTDTAEWTAIKVTNGAYYVISIFTDYIVVRQASNVSSSSNESIHKAYCKTDAGAATTIVAYLDTDTTGDEITVNCSIAGGGNLNAAIPRLANGTLIFVIEIDSTWYCTTVFQATEDCVC